MIYLNFSKTTKHVYELKKEQFEEFIVQLMN